ncbi:GNAT family N-acetyltransferase [Phocaeicola intestinalis]|nr:GNAT family N-acetyltransferase [Phocaeicola intestinalis]
MISDIIIRKFDTKMDLLQFHKLHSDPSSMQFYGMNEFKTTEESYTLMTSYINSELNKKSIHRVIADAFTNEYLGEIGVFNINAIHNRANAYCILLPECRKKGYSVKASSLFYKEVFESTEINRIQALVDCDNINAIKSLKGLGFIHEGRLKEYELDRGRYIDIDIFALLKSRFYYIVPWISWKEYIVDGLSKTLIYEQRSHKYYLLSGETSLIWKTLASGGFTVNQDISSLSILIDEGIIIFYAPLGESKNSSGTIEIFDKSPDTFYEKIKNEGYVYDIHWDITNRCNEKCVHCYNMNAHSGHRNEHENELSFEEAVKLVDELSYLGVFRLAMSGGEVLMKDYFIKLCQYIRSKNIQLIIYTNGLAFNEKLLQVVASLFPSTVCFSVYGNNSNVHDSVTGVKGAYNKILYALSYFKEKHIETSHKNTALSINYHCWKETLAKGYDLSDSSMLNCTIYPSMDDRKLSKYSLDETQLLQMAMSSDSPIYYKSRKIGACNINKDPSETPCYNKTNTLYINPFGEVGLCIAFPCVIASLRNNDIRCLKRKKKDMPFIEDFTRLNGVELLDNWRSLKIADLKECGKYDYCKFCIDVCPGDAFLLNNDLLSAPQNHCSIAIARHHAFMLNLYHT